MKTFPVHSDPGAAANFPTSAGADFSLVSRKRKASARRNLWRIELAMIAALLVGLNFPLLLTGGTAALALYPAALREGEWWRLITHPFVHVSWYHLALDASAFFLAYTDLAGRRFWERLCFVVAGGAGGWVAAVLASPLIETHGLCGLSGLVHGLTAVVAVEMLRSKTGQTVRLGGLVCFLCVVGKSIWEALTGNILFASWHLGTLGTPIAACHAGGVLGALAAWLLMNRTSHQPSEMSVPPAPKRG